MAAHVVDLVRVLSVTARSIAVRLVLDDFHTAAGTLALLSRFFLCKLYEQKIIDDMKKPSLSSCEIISQMNVISTNHDNYRYHVQLSDSVLLYRKRQRYAILLDQHFVLEEPCFVSPVHSRETHLPFKDTEHYCTRYHRDDSKDLAQ